MKIAMWSGLGRVGEFCTGVGKHILNMSCGLNDRVDCEVSLILSSDLAKRDATVSEASRMDALRDESLPFSRRSAEVMWRLLNWPSIDKWTQGADWVYCPKELYVPVRNAKYALTVHDLYPIEPDCGHSVGISSHRWGKVFKRSLDRANVVLAVSDFTKSRIVELMGIKEEKIRVVGNGVEEEYFAPLDGTEKGGAWDEASVYAVSIGGITRKKGGGRLLDVASVLERTMPELRIVVIGPVERAYKRRLETANNVQIVHRGLPNEVLRERLGGAAVALSLSEYEGFGIPALEAMAVGTPVVVAKRGALPEVVGDAGFVVDPDNVPSVVEVVTSLVKDSEMRAAAVKSGRRHVEAHRWSQCVQRLYDALNEFSEE